MFDCHLIAGFRLSFFGEKEDRFISNGTLRLSAAEVCISYKIDQPGSDGFSNRLRTRVDVHLVIDVSDMGAAGMFRYIEMRRFPCHCIPWPGIPVFPIRVW